jgi:hypothetical protein
LSRQCAAVLVHQLLPRILSRAFGAERAAQGGNDDDDYHKRASRKRAEALEFASGGLRTADLLGMAVIGTAPVDHMSLRLQHLDHTQGSMRELVDQRPQGLLPTAQHHLWQILNTWRASDRSGQLATLEWLMKSLSADADLTDSARATCTGIAAAVWTRLQLRRPSNPIFVGVSNSNDPEPSLIPPQQPDLRTLITSAIPTPTTVSISLGIREEGKRFSETKNMQIAGPLLKNHTRF